MCREARCFKIVAMKKNCWEYKGCGREPGGEREGELGTCPAPLEEKLHGVHGGTNAGRACWVVAGTMCGEEVQGTFARKCINCIDCDFFGAVMEAEAARFLTPNVLLGMLGQYRGPLP